jgi:sugar (pentulose or hexulose) kinase
MDKSLILAIDNGTQSLRALLFDKHGQIQGKSQVFYNPYDQPAPGYCEQDPEVYWRALGEACQQLWHDGHNANAVAALTVTSQRTSIVPVDEQGTALIKAAIWLDQRKAKNLKPMSVVWRSLFKVLGLSSTVISFREKALSNWLDDHNPQLLSKVHKWLFLSGYLSFKLTGEYRDSRASQVGYVPFDYKKQRWGGGLDWKWQALAMKPNQLPELIDSGKTMGLLTAEAAAACGLEPGVPVVASGADKACEVLGSGGVSPDVACLSFGTTATVNVCSPHYREVVKHIPAYPAVLSGHFCYEAMLFRGFWMVSWFKEQFGLEESQRVLDADGSVEALFDELVDAVPAGSMGLVLQPYWGAGLREPGPEAKGAVIGFGDVHKREHLYRSILEGLVFGLLEGFEKIQKRCGVNPTILRVSGGGSQSNAAMQIAADVFGMPAERPHTSETSGLGAAIAVATGLGWYDDMEQAVTQMVHPGDVFQPIPANHEIYQQLYRDVYLKMYPKLQPLYTRIREITGYPE